MKKAEEVVRSYFVHSRPGGSSLVSQLLCAQKPAAGDQHRTRHVLVEFSSPNIAKPFHVGHLRSTFIGRFLANLLRASEQQVTTINYLGDWGTQFGLLAHGFRRFGQLSCDQLEQCSNPMMPLLDIYVKANQVAKPLSDGQREQADAAEFVTEAKQLFHDMEAGKDEEALRFWRTARRVSLQEFARIYERLAVPFDVTDAESMYAAAADQLVSDYVHGGYLTVGGDGSCVFETENNGRAEAVILRKRDGTSLYLSRDVAALLDRERRFGPFDVCYYVVDHSQTHHFRHMRQLLCRVGRADLADKVRHVPFGTVVGMSTRKGNMVHATQYFEVGVQKARQRLVDSYTRKVADDELDDAATQIALTAVVVHDFSRQRGKSYSFDWDTALGMKGDTGHFLQSAHARLNNLRLHNANAYPDWERRALDDYSPGEYGFEGATLRLAESLMELPLVLENCRDRLDPSVLLRYAFSLARHLGPALASARVAGQPDKVAIPRLMLFGVTQTVLADCLRLFGLQPLNNT